MQNEYINSPEVDALQECNIDNLKMYVIIHELKEVFDVRIFDYKIKHCVLDITDDLSSEKMEELKQYLHKRSAEISLTKMYDETMFAINGNTFHYILNKNDKVLLSIAATGECKNGSQPYSIDYKIFNNN